ncbi:hypothetical protein HMI56_004634, partial [Coelomomyces lativittatus]
MALRKVSLMFAFPRMSLSGSVVSGLKPCSLKPVTTSRPFSSQSLESTSDTENSEPLSSADHAFLARTGLSFLRNETYLQALTHKSYLHGKLPYNDRLEYLGQKVLGLYVTEYIHAKYPNIFYDGLRDAVNAYTCLNTLNRFGRFLGIPNVVRWQPKDTQKTGEDRIVAKAVMALIGAIYHDKGSIVAKKFIHACILSQKIDMNAIINLKQPKRLLSALLKRKHMEPPISRLLSETGRHSATPAFVVGVFSGFKKFGEGYGSSIKMAEHR